MAQRRAAVALTMRGADGGTLGSGIRSRAALYTLQEGRCSFHYQDSWSSRAAVPSGL